MLLEAYDHGSYGEIEDRLKAAETLHGLDDLDGKFKEEATRWIDTGAASQRTRRAFVAGSVALELTHALTDVGESTWEYSSHVTNPDALPAMVRLVSHLPDASRTTFERDWTLAVIATLENWDEAIRLSHDDDVATAEPAWAVLAGTPPLNNIAKTQDAFGGKGGYLASALAQFPDEPRLLLARAEAVEVIETRCAPDYCHDEMSPAVMQELRSRARVDAPPYHGWAYVVLRRTHNFALVNLSAFDRLLPVATEFAQLGAKFQTIRDEADVHVGYTAIRAQRADAALAPLATAATSDDPYIRYLAEYLTGRALEALRRRTDAIAAYRRALAVVPRAHSAATLLAAALFSSDDPADRLEAHSLLENMAAGVSPPSDPWDSYWLGDARLWPIYMEHLRQDLRR